MNFELNEENRILQRTVRDFADSEIWPYSTEWDDNHVFPYHIFKEMGELGLMGLLIPEEYGGSGGSLLSYAVAMEEICRGCPSIGLTWGGHMSLGVQPFVLFGNEDQKRKYLPKFATGQYLGAFGLTEPNAGSDASSIQTRAVQDGDEWVINGTKCFISNPGTDISYGVVILAISGVDDKGKKEFSNFIVEKGTPGYTIGKQYDKMAWCSGDTHELIFEDCRIPQ
jgi:alkylation response protein AidB-like acyl-CoA dehydrogenase